MTIETGDCMGLSLQSRLRMRDPANGRGRDGAWWVPAADGSKMRQPSGAASAADPRLGVMNGAGSASQVRACCAVRIDSFLLSRRAQLSGDEPGEGCILSEMLLGASLPKLRQLFLSAGWDIAGACAGRW